MILTSAARASALTLAGEHNNPLVTGESMAVSESPAITTSIGTEDADGAAANAVTGTTYDYWTAAPSSGEAAWQAAFSADVSPTFVAIAAHNIADVTATVRVEYSTDGSSWTDCGAGPETPDDNQAICWRFSAVDADYWRVRVTGADDDVSIGVIWIGSEIIVSRRFYQGYSPPITPTEVTRVPNVSEGGHLLGVSAVRQGSTAAASFSYIAPAFLRGATWKAFQARANDGEGFFFAWRPTKYGDLHYAWLQSGAMIRPENTGPKDLMGFNVGMRFYDDP